jgi:ubiquinone/menaquinone biosynthesis C-methylase UbiE
MFAETPELYDAIYGSFKDYEAESARIAELLRQRIGNARKVLDVACGTGEHARWLQQEHGYLVEGLDLEPGLVAIARSKLPESRFWIGDMAAFELDTKFDAILCLFSSIGYLLSLDRVEQALRCFRRHLTPEGIVIVEPWFEPEAWTPGRITVRQSDSGAPHVVRMAHSTVDGRTSKVEFHYLIGSESGIEHRVEHHELGLFEHEELAARFIAAGFAEIELDDEGLTGRGIFIARCAAASALRQSTVR